MRSIFLPRRGFAPAVEEARITGAQLRLPTPAEAQGHRGRTRMARQELA